MKALILASTVAVAASVHGSSAGEEFARENTIAMERMMSSMHSVSSGDVDRDFVSMMTPHHQGAIDMARLELRYGRNETLRRMAQEIIVTQTAEIQAMALAIDTGERK